MIFSDFNNGIKVLKKVSSSIPKKSGVYKMLSLKNEILYVGKAKNLKKRLTSYINPSKLNYRLQKMISMIRKIEYIVTENEALALLLEANLIKEIKPKFNILLKDDKSYPNISIRVSHEWPQLKKHRGKKNKNDIYYGPFASAGHVNLTINTLQKIFPLRTCSDYEIQNRIRPCIQYQIKRCVAPCVSLIEKDKYLLIVRELQNYMNGKDKTVINQLISKMNVYSKDLKYEEAAQIRDKVRALENISLDQKKEWKEIHTADIFCITLINKLVAIEAIFCRNGHSFGSNTHFLSNQLDERPSEILNKFLVQFYNNKTVPNKIIISHLPEEMELLEEALSISRHQKVRITLPYDISSERVVKEGLNCAKTNLANRIAKKERVRSLNQMLQHKFKIKKDLNRIEVYDNSHFSGKEAIGSYIVANDKGFLNSDYRKFNIKNANTKDDYSMLTEVLSRRFKNIKNNPDLLIIDGGKGQLSVAIKKIKELSLTKIHIIAISKGKMRNASNERFFNYDGTEVKISKIDPLFYYLQRLRDEAHRYAINNHRTLRKKNTFLSELDLVSDIGPKRKKSLLLHFGSVREIKNAKLEELKKVPGINDNIAEKVYNYFNLE